MTRNPHVERHWLFFKLMIVCITVIALSTSLHVLQIPLQKLIGKGLNGRAWRGSYTERHLPVPSWGPREGFWGDHLPKKLQDAAVGWIDPQVELPDRVEIDAHSLQHAIQYEDAPRTLLILGGSVAFGAYSSSIRRVYFNQMAFHLAQSAHPLNVTVLACGAWQSINELQALRFRGVALRPNYVMFLDGMNDLTAHSERSLDDSVRIYLKNMKEARDLALAHHIKVIFALQPFLPQKPLKSYLEQIILRESYPEPERLILAYEQIRAGLRSLTVPGGAFFIDCSGAFDPFYRTVFSDLWHFSDVGHARLGLFLAGRLTPILDRTDAAAFVPRKRLPSFTHRLHPADTLPFADHRRRSLVTKH